MLAPIGTSLTPAQIDSTPTCAAVPALIALARRAAPLLRAAAGPGGGASCNCCPDVDDVAVVQKPVDQRCGHDLVAQYAAPFLEAIAKGHPASEIDELLSRAYKPASD